MILKYINVETLIKYTTLAIKLSVYSRPKCNISAGRVI